MFLWWSGVFCLTCLFFFVLQRGFQSAFRYCSFYRCPQVLQFSLYTQRHAQDLACIDGCLLQTLTTGVFVHRLFASANVDLVNVQVKFQTIAAKVTPFAPPWNPLDLWKHSTRNKQNGTNMLIIKLRYRSIHQPSGKSASLHSQANMWKSTRWKLICNIGNIR